MSYKGYYFRLSSEISGFKFLQSRQFKGDNVGISKVRKYNETFVTDTLEFLQTEFFSMPMLITEEGNITAKGIKVIQGLEKVANVNILKYK